MSKIIPKLRKPEMRKVSAGAAIECYIDQRDKLWRQLAIDQAKLSSVALNLLKDRNDFIDALFRFKKIVPTLFGPERIKYEQNRTEFCYEFIRHMHEEIQQIIRNGDALLNS